MTIAKPTLVVGLLMLCALPAFAAPAYSIKTIADSAPPKEVHESIRKVLNNQCIQLLDGKGTLLLEVWLAKDVEVKATEVQIKNGLTYREVPSSTIFGAARVPKLLYDYRKQKIAAGVYTLRFAAQPMDGDHMGTAPYSDFCLLCPASDDKKVSLLSNKALHEMSGKSTDGHPGVFLLFPGKSGKEPKLESKEMNHWVLMTDLSAKAGDKKATLSIGLVLVGVSASL